MNKALLAVAFVCVSAASRDRPRVKNAPKMTQVMSAA